MSEEQPLNSSVSVCPKRPCRLCVFVCWVLCLPSRLLQLHRIRRPVPLRWLAGLLAFVLNLCYWLLLFVCLGGLGPLIRFVGVPAVRLAGVPVTLEGCSVWPLTGSVRLEGLRVANPERFLEADGERYGGSPLLDLEELGVGVNLFALKNNVIHIRELTLRGTTFFFAQDSRLGTDNVSALITQIAPPSGTAASISEESVGTTDQDTEPAPDTPAQSFDDVLAKLRELPQFRIDSLNVSENRIRTYLDFGIPGLTPDVTLEQPPLRRTGYDNEALIADVRALAEMLSSDGSTLLQDAAGEIRTVGEELRRDVREALESGDTKKAGEDLKDSVKDLKESAQGLRDSLKGLF